MFKNLHGREANPATRLWNVTKTLLQTTVFWTVFLLLLPWLFYTLETTLGLARWRFTSGLWQVVGVALFIVGGSLGIWSGVVMASVGKGTPLPLDCARVLVVAGPYRHVRNPMAVAGIAQGVAVGLIWGSPAVVLYALAGAPAWNVLVKPWEELDMVQRFGEQYEDYRAAIKCWVPSPRPYSVRPISERSNGDTPGSKSE